MSSQLAEMCRALDAVRGDISNMARKLAEEATRLRSAAAQAGALARSENSISFAAANAASAFDAAARSCQRAAQLLSDADRTAGEYIAALYSGATSGSTTGRAPGSPSHGDGQFQAIGSTGMMAVPLSLIGNTEGIDGPTSFSKMSYEAMQDGFGRLAETVLPAVQRGEGADYFRELDHRLGLTYENGYLGIYDLFFGDDAVRLSWKGGQLDITNGRHRVYVARQLGLDSIPARL